MSSTLFEIRRATGGKRITLSSQKCIYLTRRETLRDSRSDLYELHLAFTASEADSDTESTQLIQVAALGGPIVFMMLCAVVLVFVRYEYKGTNRNVVIFQQLLRSWLMPKKKDDDREILRNAMDVSLEPAPNGDEDGRLEVLGSEWKDAVEGMANNPNMENANSLTHEIARDIRLIKRLALELRMHQMPNGQESLKKAHRSVESSKYFHRFSVAGEDHEANNPTSTRDQDVDVELVEGGARSPPGRESSPAGDGCL